MKSTLLTLDVLLLPKVSLTTMQMICLLMASPLARTSSCNACDHLMASPAIQVLALEPPPQRDLSEPSTHSTNFLSCCLSNSLHVTHHYCCYSFTISLPQDNMSSERVTTFFCLICCYIPRDELCSSEKWVNKKNATHAPVTRMSWQARLLCNYLQKQKGLLHYNLSLDGHRIKSIGNSGK